MSLNIYVYVTIVPPAFCTSFQFKHYQHSSPPPSYWPPSCPTPPVFTPPPPPPPVGGRLFLSLWGVRYVGTFFPLYPIESLGVWSHWWELTRQFIDVQSCDFILNFFYAIFGVLHSTPIYKQPPFPSKPLDRKEGWKHGAQALGKKNRLFLTPIGAKILIAISKHRVAYKRRLTRILFAFSSPSPGDWQLVAGHPPRFCSNWYLSVSVKM